MNIRETDARWELSVEVQESYIDAWVVPDKEQRGKFRWHICKRWEGTSVSIPFKSLLIAKKFCLEELARVTKQLRDEWAVEAERCAGQLEDTLKEVRAQSEYAAFIQGEFK